jgi:small subunit ribosomal protein S1
MADELDPSSEDFATLFAQQEAKPALHVGQVVKGRVIHIGAEGVFIDAGGKGEAWIDRLELTDDEGRLKVGVGDEVEAIVVRTGDEVRLSFKLRQGAQSREALQMAASTGVPVEGKVAGVIKGGYEVTVAGLRAFCPFSQMDLRRVESPEEHVGRVLEFRIVTYGEGGRNVVLSRRRLLEEEAAKNAEVTRQKLAVGAVLPGTVAALADFGAFVDLGGIQGLVPVSEISHSRVGRPADRLRERQVVRGRAVRATDFGIFVELLPGVDGLLHLSEIPPDRQRAFRESAANSDEITVLVAGIDTERRRIALALAPEGAVPGAQLESGVAANAVLTGTVERVEPFGVFVRLGPGQTGLIPNAELGTPRGTDPRKAFPPGTEVKVLVISIEEGGRRIRLSREQAVAHEEQAETQAYMRDAQKKGGGFGTTLGERIRQAQKK